MPCQGREGSQYEGLPEGDTGDRQAAHIIRLDTASDEGGMSREYSGGTPWLRDRLGSHAFLHSAAKKSPRYMVSRGLSSDKHGKGGGGFRGTGYDRYVACASHCHWQCPLLASTPGVYSTT
jgi:hypothetical protein